jgi:hypothetical protein
VGGILHGIDETDCSGLVRDLHGFVHRVDRKILGNRNKVLIR